MEFISLPETIRRKALNKAAREALKTAGYTLTRLPGRGLSSNWVIRKGKEEKTITIRTSNDRCIAFQPMNDGKKWRTLDDVDDVVVGVVNSKEKPTAAEVYRFPAKEVKKRFQQAYAVKTKSGKPRDGYGLWIELDEDNRESYGVGSGITKVFEPIATLPLEGLSDGDENQEIAAEVVEVPEALPELTTIAAVLSWARQRVADIAGVAPEAVKLDLKLEG